MASRCSNHHHSWSDHGYDNPPEEGTPCDCGRKTWKQPFLNPFLERAAKKGGISHGRKSEKKIARKIGARLHPNSGAMAGVKSDASLKESNFRLEMKSTVNQTLSLEMLWLSKISQEAVVHNQRPGLIISFVDPQGNPRMRYNAEWVMMPMEVFKELTNG